jgi:hypothetical protein
MLKMNYLIDPAKKENPRPSLCEKDPLLLSYIPYTYYFPLPYYPSCILKVFGKGFEKKIKQDLEILGFEPRGLPCAKGPLYH